jgi:4-hydroxythreonine-4-phosphate dehydrogenase
MPKRKKIAITIGDPAGIGPEVALRAVLNDEVMDLCNPLIIGDKPVLEETAQALDISIDLGAYDVLGTGEIKGRDFQKSRTDAANGRACVSYIRKAVELAQLRIVDAVVTAPITKESIRMAGFPWPGHTELLAELTATADYAMMLCGGPLRVILVTIHRPLRDVPGLITRENVFKTIVLAEQACRMMGIGNPQIAVAGLNPHAGESGLFGSEEIDEIAPAVQEAWGRGIPVSGPYPADTLFHRAYQGEFDVIVSMYHDQGLVPLKMIAFDTGVNVTIGLPVIRTSPDHGSAYDRAWKGIANPSSMIEAVKFAVSLSRSRE